MAVEAKTMADEKKLVQVLEQLRLEDPSFYYHSNKETGQLIIGGMGELHLEIIAGRLEREFKVGVRTGQPTVSYRESIATKAKGEASFHQEQGGKMVFGQVKLEVEPTLVQDGIEIESKLSKKDLPLSFAKEIEKSIRDTAQGGIIAGYPLINLRATILAAPYREEDSVKEAYSIASSRAFNKACRQGLPLLMAPIMDLEVVTPAEYTGDIIGDINGKGGKIISVTPRHSKEVICGEVPLAKNVWLQHLSSL